ncbi:MAG: hypothetical protein HYS04_02210 [Acidobacteria bacterium]|nr:hypothetical protein [Acidobacteriota bacterium]
MLRLFVPLAAGALVCAANPLRGTLSPSRITATGATVSPGPRPDTIRLEFNAAEPGTVTIPLPAAARDWTGAGCFRFTFRSNSTIRWSIALRNASGQTFGYRVQPYEGVRATASIPASFLAREYMNNRNFKAHWLSNWGNHINLGSLEALVVSMAPNRGVTLELGPLELSQDVLPDEAEITVPLVDQFGQWIPGSWPGKVGSLADLREAWREEDRALAASRPDPALSRYGGWKQKRFRGTGFFRLEQQDRRSWLVDPSGYAFFSLGLDCLRVSDPTRARGREALFARLPPNAAETADFYTANIALRYGSDFFSPWRKKIAQRLTAWGFNTIANWSDPRLFEKADLPYVTNVRIGRSDVSWQGFPDVFSGTFAAAAREDAGAQCAPAKNDPSLIGWFIGNEPRWHDRNLIDRILQDPSRSATRDYVQKYIAARGDTPASRAALLEKLARKYFQTVADAIRAADPNHLVLGIRWAGNTPDPVLRANDVFDVFSVNTYRFEPDPALYERFHKLSGRPILIGEFHFGAPERGYAPSLVMVRDQKERGVAYRYYVEHAAAMPAVIGAHYFQFKDQPVTGRFDGENYNLGFVNQQDLPYPQMIEAARETHHRVYRIHSGETPPAEVTAKVR